MKILLILPYDRTYFYKGFFHRFISYAPLTLITLAALVPQELGAGVTLVDEGVQTPRYEGETYDIVGITGVTSAMPRAYFLAEYWKKRGAYVVLGGAHATLLPEEALLHADTVIVGLAEKAWPAFLSDFAAGKPKRRYDHRPEEEQLSMPVPARHLLNNRLYQGSPAVLANRGCRNQCGYCAIPSMWGNQGLTRPIEEVLGEIRALDTKDIILLDPSPNSNEAYARALYQALIPLKIRWVGLSTIDVANKPDLLELMVKSGCRAIVVGFESFEQANLDGVDKRINVIEAYRESIKKLHAHNLGVIGCFVLGFDHDTKESLKAMVDKIQQLGIEYPRYAVLTPMPGTPLFKKMKEEGRILTGDYSLYDTEHVVFQPKHMTPEELEGLLKYVWVQSFTFKRIWQRLRHIRGLLLLRLSVNLGFRFYGRRLAKEKKGAFDPTLIK